MAVSERQGDGRVTSPSGLYRHKETGETLIAMETSKFGNPQADAYTRLGFEYVGPAPKDTPVAVDPHAAPLATPMGVESVAELKAKLAAAEQREAESKARLEEVQKAQTEQNKQNAKETKNREDAVQTQIEAQTKSDVKTKEAEETLNEKGNK